MEFISVAEESKSSKTTGLKTLTAYNGAQNLNVLLVFPKH